MEPHAETRLGHAASDSERDAVTCSFLHFFRVASGVWVIVFCRRVYACDLVCVRVCVRVSVVRVCQICLGGGPHSSIAASWAGARADGRGRACGGSGAIARTQRSSEAPPGAADRGSGNFRCRRRYFFSSACPGHKNISARQARVPACAGRSDERRSTGRVDGAAPRAIDFGSAGARPTPAQFSYQPAVITLPWSRRVQRSAHGTSAAAGADHQRRGCVSPTLTSRLCIAFARPLARARRASPAGAGHLRRPSWWRRRGRRRRDRTRRRRRRRGA